VADDNELLQKIAKGGRWSRPTHRRAKYSITR